MGYTQEDLKKMSIDSLVNIITSVCDSGVPEYLRDMRACKAELTRRGKRVRLVSAPSQVIPGKTGRRAELY